MARTVTIGAASRQLPGEAVNGDAWRVDWHNGQCRIAVIDGLGHGPLAAEASNAALSTLAAFPELDSERALLACHTALSHTRGAAMSIVCLDPVHAQLVYAGIGNVEGVLCQTARQTHLVAYRGIVGANIGRVRSATLPLESGWLLVLHTDGVSTKFELPKLVADFGSDPPALAREILAGWGQSRDDATVVVAAASVGPLPH
jgi:serine phosphatase RsbU (regulator of sigma subunit)